MSNVLEVFGYAGGAFAILLLFQWAGTPMVWRVFRSTDVVRLPLARFATGYGLAATGLYALLHVGVPIRLATWLVLGVMAADTLWCARERSFRKWLWLGSFSVRRSYWLPVFFALLLGVLFTSPRFQIAYHGWMHISTERNIAWGLWPNVSPGLVHSPIERSMGGSIVLGSLSSVTGFDVMPILCAWRICVVLMLFSVAGTFLRAFGLPRRLRAHLPGLYMTLMVLTPMVLWFAWCVKGAPIFTPGSGEPGDGSAVVRERISSSFHSKDVLREIWMKFSPDRGSTLTDCLDKTISGEYLLPGTVFAGLSLAGALFLRGVRARLFLVGMCVWTVSIIYTLQLIPAGIAALLVGWRSLPTLRKGFGNGSWRTWLGVAALGAVCLGSLVFGKSIQSAASAAALLENGGGSPPRVTAMPHIPNLLAPLGLFWIPVLLGWPLVRFRAPVWRMRFYFWSLGLLIFCILFVRMPAGLSYKWSYVLLFFALPPLGALLLLIQRSARHPRLVTALHWAVLIYLPFTLDIVLRLRSDWYRAPILAQLDPTWSFSQGDEHARYVARILPALDWIREHTPRESYVLYYPDQPGCAGAASNFAPSYYTRRRFVYVEDPLYVKPMPLAVPVRKAVEAVYSGTPVEQATALRQISSYGRVFAISALPWVFDGEAAGCKEVLQNGEIRVYELPPAASP